MRLRRVTVADLRWRRVRRGRGFTYLDADGNPLVVDDVERVRALAVPPAWTDVSICPYPRGHLQAVGIDAAGRRQYLYHPEWRVQRDVEKFERIAAYAPDLPRLRRTVRREMTATADDEETQRRRVLATAIRLLDLGCFRPGSDAAVEGSHGLTTLERRHVRRDGDALWFRFVGKANVDQEARIEDPEVLDAVLDIAGSRRRNARLLGSPLAGRWTPITADEINARLAELSGGAWTAKDFRTWHATVVAAVTLADQPLPSSRRTRKARLTEAYEAAAALLGNTPTVARNSYIDPRVVDLFEAGTVLESIPRTPDAADRAVAALLHAA
jgi:DNA topoisomerase I